MKKLKWEKFIMEQTGYCNLEVPNKEVLDVTLFLSINDILREQDNGIDVSFNI